MTVLVAHTDGSCLKNPGGRGGWAFMLTYADGSCLVRAGHSPSTTNNQMEMIAALNAINDARTYGFTSLILHTDSQYVQKGMTEWMEGWKKRGWRTSTGGLVLNRDIWERLDEGCLGINIDWRWVRGHSGVLGNEVVDTLANWAAHEQTDFAEYVCAEKAEEYVTSLAGSMNALPGRRLTTRAR